MFSSKDQLLAPGVVSVFPDFSAVTAARPYRRLPSARSALVLRLSRRFLEVGIEVTDLRRSETDKNTKTDANHTTGNGARAAADPPPATGQ